MQTDLAQFGFDDWFLDRVDPEMSRIHDIARVVSVHRNGYLVSRGSEAVFAELSGRLMYTTESVAELPTTGDWVYVDFFDDDSHAIIHALVPRKTIIQRKQSGNVTDFQLIAANIDLAFILQSVDANFNLRRLERYLVMINESRIEAVILLSKSDLVSTQVRDEIVQNVRTIAAGNQIIIFSNETGDNIDSIEQLLVSGKSYCLLGSSGVGKTTLLNRLSGSDAFETQTVSKKGSKGRHTTTTRELIRLRSGAVMIDTPGMRELGNMGVDSGIDETFGDISSIISQCRFSDCTHTNEQGCAVLSALQTGQLSKARYENFVKIKNESDFNELSYYEKRQKDKSFGKLVKNAVKGKHRY